MLRNLVAVLFLLTSVNVFAAVEQYEIDPAHTYPNFTINHLGYSKMHGRFGTTSGSISLDRDTMMGSVDITIDAASVDTGFKKRDDHLRSPDFLNAVEYPTITYKANNVKLNKDGSGMVKGKLSLAGVTKDVTLSVDQMNCAIHPFDPSKQKFVCGFNATTTINRSDFGVKYGLPAIGDEMQIEFEVEAVRK